MGKKEMKMPEQPTCEAASRNGEDWVLGNGNNKKLHQRTCPFSRDPAQYPKWRWVESYEAAIREGFIPAK